LETRILVNGVDGVTGAPLAPLPDSGRIADALRPAVVEPGIRGWLRTVLRSRRLPHLGLPFGADPADASQAGWSVVFPTAGPPAIERAMAPLIEHRRTRLGSRLVRVLDYQPGEDWRSWLARHGAEPGSVRPDKVPYYVLLAAGPDLISYEFQHLLSVEYAVGRLGFDEPGDVSRYVESLVDYETAAAVPGQKAAVFFGTRHPFDAATQLSADQLVRPLAAGPPAAGADSGGPGVAEAAGFATRLLVGEDATKANLGAILHSPAGAEPPALLFTATHGVGWPRAHPRQLAAQGALVCQDLPGFGHIDGSHYFAADDLADDARVRGMICFHFACYGAGTPLRDDFWPEPAAAPPEIAERPFVARLPQRLLAHPRGGALAVLGHLDRAWGFSILGASGLPQLLPFENALRAILQGYPVGHALRDFRERFAALSTALADALDRFRHGATVADDELAGMWVERNDARNYAVLGDPAARLRVAAMSR
jgi:hypothetical protein